MFPKDPIIMKTFIREGLLTEFLILDNSWAYNIVKSVT